MQVYVIKGFERFCRKERIRNKDLVEAIDRALRGLIDADLGGGLIKQRVARPGQGKRSGYRTIIAYRACIPIRPTCQGWSILYSRSISF